MLKKLLFSLLFIFTGYGFVNSQTIPLREMGTPNFGLKTNVLYDAFTNINLGAEFKVANRNTIDVTVDYNPWTFSDNKKFKHILVQPEWRYWLCEPYNRHFLGIHAHWAYFNVGNIKLPLGIYKQLQDYRYEGWLLGGGFTYGYQWYLSPRWNLETSVGLGYFYAHYDKYDCHKCGEKLGKDHKHYIGPTKLAISLIYLIK